MLNKNIYQKYLSTLKHLTLTRPPGFSINLKCDFLQQTVFEACFDAFIVVISPLPFPHIEFGAAFLFGVALEAPGIIRQSKPVAALV